MNFGVSALLLKAFTQIAASLFTTPARLDLWAAQVSIVTMLFGVRSAAARPLRRALEGHDKLSVLAFYGVVSSIAASVTGGLVYGEMDNRDDIHQALYYAVAILHCWGMCSLGYIGSDLRGHKEADKDVAGKEAPTSTRRATEFGKALQIAEASGTLNSGGCSATEPPLLFFNEPASRTVDEDAQIEEKLFAHALAPLHLGPSMGGLPVGTEDAAANWAPSWPDAGGGGEGLAAASAAPALAPQFDADFEEIMRRFDEDDRESQLITDLSSGPTAGHPVAQDVPSVLTYDAQTLLDDSCGVQYDEDELLRTIEDIPGP